GLEGGIEVAAAGDVEQDVPPSGGRRVEEPSGAIEPPRREPRERRPLVLPEPGRAPLDLLAHGPLGEPPERDELAARADRLGQGAEVVRDEEDYRVGRRLLQIL